MTCQRPGVCGPEESAQGIPAHWGFLWLASLISSPGHQYVLPQAHRRLWIDVIQKEGDRFPSFQTENAAFETNKPLKVHEPTSTFLNV